MRPTLTGEDSRSPSPTSDDSTRQVRRSPFTVCYWDGEGLIAHHYRSQTKTRLGLISFSILDQLAGWTRVQNVLELFQGIPADALRAAIGQLIDAGLLDQQPSSADTPGSAADYASWGEWNPVAAFFHAATRDVKWAGGEEREAFERDVEGRRPQAPTPSKRYAGQPIVGLERHRVSGELARTLRERRTWREFGREPIELRDVAELLDLTWGVQHRIAMPSGPPIHLKTSPSGGAAHPIEVYVYARRVRGLGPGFYHYAADSHELSLVARGATRSQLEGYLGGQWWFAPAPVTMFMTAVFARKQFRYPKTPRMYRSILIEAGHLCQTFCLLATARGLAPFCTAALADSAIERALGLDGRSEAVLYAAGVGNRPPGAENGQWPEHAEGKPYLRPRPRSKASKPRGR